MIERDIHPLTIGRKAWLFSDSVAGADASAVLYSLIDLPRLRHRAYADLSHVLTELPKRKPGADVTDLLPFNFTVKPSTIRRPSSGAWGN